MFQGFNEATIKYYKEIKKENSKATHQEYLAWYQEGIKQPLEELYYELYHHLGKIDTSLQANKRRCISTAYNDARFSKEDPIKEYCYLHFKLDKEDKKNAPGFFFDAGLDGYRYGLNIYHLDSKGMEKIRDYILDNKNYSRKIIRQFHNSKQLDLCGEMYKKDRFVDEDPILREWLMYKRFSFSREFVLDDRFYSRELLHNICTAFDSAADVYTLIKEALEDDSAI